MSDYERLKAKLEALEIGSVPVSVLINSATLRRALGVSRAKVFKASAAASEGAELVSLEALFADEEPLRSVALGVDKDKELSLKVAEYASARASELVLVGEKRLGVASVEKYLAERMEGVAKFPLKDIGRVSLWRRSLPLEISSEGLWSETQAEVRGVRLCLWTLAGIPSAVDPLADCLAEAIEEFLRPDLRMLDLGCGNGALGAWAVKKEPRLRLTLTDDDANAIAGVRRTFQANDLGAEKILCADGLAGIGPVEKFDLIAANPPFVAQGGAADFSVAQRWLSQAASCVCKGGALWVAAHRFCPYEGFLKAHFSSVEKVFEDAKYKVIRAII